MQLNLLLLVFTALASASIPLETATRTFIALLPESERSYVTSGRDRFNWLSGTLEHLMDIDDEIRASHVLGLIEGWGHYLGPTSPEYLELARRHSEAFVKFSLNLRQTTEIRRARCTENTLLGGAIDRTVELCSGQQETESERILNDSILVDVLHKDIRAAYQKLDTSAVPRQLKMEMLLMSSTLQLRNRVPCVKLWDDGWNLAPEQKYEALKAYWSLLFTLPSRDLSESQLLAAPLLAGIRARIPHGHGIAERVLLAVGNRITEARLSVYPGLFETVRKCQVLNRTRLYPLGGLAHPYLDRASLLGRFADGSSLLDRAIPLVDRINPVDRTIPLERAIPLVDRTIPIERTIPVADRAVPLVDPSLVDRTIPLDRALDRPSLDLDLDSRVPTPRMLLEDRLVGSPYENHLAARRLAALRSPLPLATGVFPGDTL